MQKLLIGFTALLLALGGLTLWLGGDRGSPPLLLAPSAIEATPGVIYAAHFPDVDGNEQSLGQWQQKLLVINFWATWCGPCREEMPLLSRLHSEFAPKGLQVVGIAADSRANVVNFIKTSPVSYPLLPDEAGAIAFSKRLGNPAGLMPYTVILKPHGEVIFVRLGVVTEPELRKILVKNM
jgi:thiol-disulfide isomerase/thioredoxin